jgi:hypothetical protein
LTFFSSVSPSASLVVDFAGFFCAPFLIGQKLPSFTENHSSLKEFFEHSTAKMRIDLLRRSGRLPCFAFEPHWNRDIADRIVGRTRSQRGTLN